MYDFSQRDRRDEVAVTREIRMAFTEVMVMVCALAGFAVLVWGWL